MSSLWVKCRHIVEECIADNTIDQYEQEIIEIIGGISPLLKLFFVQSPSIIPESTLESLWNLLSTKRFANLNSTEDSPLLSLPHDVLSSICTYLNISDLTCLNRVNSTLSIIVRLPNSHHLAVKHQQQIDHIVENALNKHKRKISQFYKIRHDLMLLFNDEKYVDDICQTITRQMFAAKYLVESEHEKVTIFPIVFLTMLIIYKM